jgi:rhamnosyltransferase
LTLFSADLVSIVLRSHNDKALIRRTLVALFGLTRHPFHLIALDNDSEDGTREILERYPVTLYRIPKGTYIPGRVLNYGMAVSQGEYVVFLNSDCIPQEPSWLDHLLAGFQNTPKEGATVAAVFGRQIPHPDCMAMFYKDTEATYGDGSRQKYWRHCFSMASSAIRRSVWQHLPFSETLQYSEDIDWTYRARHCGYSVVYCPRSIVQHSHNYGLKQWYRRQKGEGKAEAFIFEWSSWQGSFVRYSLLPWGRQLLTDIEFCLRYGKYGDLAYAPFLRTTQLLARRQGLLEGLQERASS